MQGDQQQGSKDDEKSQGIQPAGKRKRKGPQTDDNKQTEAAGDEEATGGAAVMTHSSAPAKSSSSNGKRTSSRPHEITSTSNSASLSSHPSTDHPSAGPVADSIVKPVSSEDGPHKKKKKKSSHPAPIDSISSPRPAPAVSTLTPSASSPPGASEVLEQRRASAPDPVFVSVSLAELNEKQRDKVYWFIKGIHTTAGFPGSRAPAREYVLEAPSLYLDASQYSEQQFTAIGAWIRQIQGRIPRIGDAYHTAMALGARALGSSARHVGPYGSFASPLPRVPSSSSSASRTSTPPPSSAVGSRQAQPTGSAARGVQVQGDVGAARARGRERQRDTASTNSSAVFVAQRPTQDPPSTYRTGDARDEAMEISDSPAEEESSPPLRSRDLSKGEESSIASEDESLPHLEQFAHPRVAPVNGPEFQPASANLAPYASPSHTLGSADKSHYIREMTEATKVLESLTTAKSPFSGDTALEQEKLPDWIQGLISQLNILTDISIIDLANPRHHIAVVSWVAKQLTGSALRWWNNITVSNPLDAAQSASGGGSQNKRFTNLYEIRDAFLKQYTVPGAKDKAHAALNSIKPFDKEDMTSYNCRFTQAAQSANVGDDVKKFLYYMSLPMAIRTQLHGVLREKNPEKTDVDVMADHNITTDVLKQQVIHAEWELHQRASLRPITSSFPSRASHHHTVAEAPPTHQQESVQLAPAMLLDATVAELNAYASRAPSFIGRPRQGDNRRQSDSARPPSASPRSSSSSNSRNRDGNANRGRDSSGSRSRGPHPVFTRGALDLPFGELHKYLPEADKACRDFPELLKLDKKVLMARIKQGLCYGCGMRTSESHTTANCRGKQYLN